ncbi:hypothetical protein Gotur_035350 [Gossypium turneri]
MIVAQDVPHEGLSIRWGTFSPRELARSENYWRSLSD